MTCPDCERYKESARNWRHKAYELSGHPLPWEGGDTWVGLTDEEQMQTWEGTVKYALGEVRVKEFARAIEAKLREKNT
jgi:hypothetical protein